MWPAMIANEERGTHDIPWSIRVESENDSFDSYKQFESSFKSIYPNSTFAYAHSTECYIARADKSLDEITESDFLKLDDVCYLRRNNDDLFPIDIFSSPEFVLEGDPKTGEGTIIDAITARRLNLHPGSSILIGSFVPKGNYKDAVSITDENGVSADYFFEKKVISAIVLPSSNFDGIACFAIERHLDAWEKYDNMYATDAYVFGLSDTEAETAVKDNEENPIMDDFYLDPGYLFTRESEDARRLYSSENNGSTPLVVALFAISLIAAALSTIRTYKKRGRFYATSIASGLNPRRVVSASVFEGAVAYACPILIGGAMGLERAMQTDWISPEIMLETWGVFALLLIATTIIQIVVARKMLSENSVICLIRKK